jgi:glutaredoxin
MIIVYSQPTCSWCNKAKQLLDDKKIEYIELTLGQEISKEEFFDKFPGVRSLPFMTIRKRFPVSEEIIGGYQELYEQIK